MNIIEVRHGPSEGIAYPAENAILLAVFDAHEQCFLARDSGPSAGGLHCTVLPNEIQRPLDAACW